VASDRHQLKLPVYFPAYAALPTYSITTMPCQQSEQLIFIIIVVIMVGVFS